MKNTAGKSARREPNQNEQINLIYLPTIFLNQTNRLTVPARLDGSELQGMGVEPISRPQVPDFAQGIKLRSQNARLSELSWELPKCCYRSWHGVQQHYPLTPYRLTSPPAKG